MSLPYISEIRLVSFNFAPKNWALCNGQILPINQNQALFALIGTTYGGNGQTTFALPNLQGMVPLHMGTGFPLGQYGGETAHLLSQPELPTHTHPVAVASSTGTVQSPAGKYWAGVKTANAYSNASPTTNLNPAVIGSYGGGQPHNNMPPYLVLNFVIALTGIFPSRT